ncbi:hypothetical protein K488DRAFT_89977 [Vararia minispora EC-137]|uniref:Uncharacterized protein n=1 Tax=Vararia minispora EC-137 TaxID=1314806 RepID=A0ACB8Q902_9AGAM|nr:hypothetical protein K488DRAFT_89977 [Vararia minispora EC-137]
MSSTQIAQWMAKGWVLTDKPCPKRVCGMPLLHSDDGTTWFCVECDKNPPAGAPPPSAQSSTASVSDKHSESRSSTPATSISSTLSSPVFAPPAETEESIRRRHQSEMASAEMAKLLLKGWAMLADECINPSCSRIPLMRPPKSGGEKDPRKQCVVCGSVYVDETDVNGFERLVPFAMSNSQNQSSEGSSFFSAPTTSTAKGKGVDRGTDNIQPSPASASPSSSQPMTDLSSVLRPKLAVSAQPSTPVHPDRSQTVLPPRTDRMSSLQATAQTLDSTLHRLTGRLHTLNEQPYLDPASVTATAQAIAATSQALVEIAKLQRLEG